MRYSEQFIHEESSESSEFTLQMIEIIKFCSEHQAICMFIQFFATAQFCAPKCHLLARRPTTADFAE